MSSWDASLYMRFGDERTRPSIDLVSRVDVVRARTIIDLGCGPGNSTQILRRRWPEAHVVGLDNSPDMIAAAREAHPDQEWILGQAETWSASEPCDVVFSNAALQWIPRHPSLVQRLFEQVAGGGALAFQIPSRNYSGVRDCIDEVALDLQWRVRMRGPMGALTMEDAPCYYDALVGQARALDMWETEYHHVLDDPTAIVTWISGTGLRPFLSVLDDDAERGRFTAMLSERVAAVYPRRADGKVLFPFKRLFVVAYR